MPAFVVLLRGVNVGKANRVPMADLRVLLQGLGYTDVATLLNSGNAVFRAAKGTSARHAADIAAVVSTRLKVDVPVIVISAKDLAGIVAGNTLSRTVEDHSRLLVAFVQDPKVLSTLGAIVPLVGPREQVLIGKHAAYLHCANGILESRAAGALLGRMGKSVTTRNWATVLKLQALVGKEKGRG
jgi:uncharacterized protein (DUF1697 family)